MNARKGWTIPDKDWRRDSEMASMRLRGVPCSVIAREYGLSLGRVYKITKEMLEERRKGRAQPDGDAGKPRRSGAEKRKCGRKGGMTKAEIRARDAKIVEKADAGVSRAEIGREFGLSRERVRQIVAVRGTGPKRDPLVPDGLSNRAGNALLRFGAPLDPDDFANAVLTGEIDIREIPGVGETSAAEIAAWCGVSIDRAECRGLTDKAVGNLAPFVEAVLSGRPETPETRLTPEGRAILSPAATVAVVALAERMENDPDMTAARAASELRRILAPEVGDLTMDSILLAAGLCAKPGRG